MAVLWTNTANCRDCYACIRACPVKAIRVSEGHAEVVEELCILDGACVGACPQGAKQVAQDLPQVEAVIGAGQVVFSLAPSVAGAFTVGPGVVAAALRRLGVTAVAETSEVTGWVSRRHWELAQEGTGMISSCCPAVTNLITRHYPGALPHLAAVVSPMVAHARAIKQAWGQSVISVFSGPCIAKKGERRDPAVAGDVDFVLTFTELRALLDRRLPRWEELAPEAFDTFVAPAPLAAPADEMRGFALPGGMRALLGEPGVQAGKSFLVVTGVGECAGLLGDLPLCGVPADLVEMMACEHGCVSGPEMGGPEHAFRREQRVREYAAMQRDTVAHGKSRRQAMLEYGAVDLSREFVDQRLHLPMPSEQEIRAILSSIGKQDVVDELNCGACGYDSCRSKAIAVFQGLAEREMCIPHMRTKAESLAEVTIAAAPTGIVVVNRSLHILALNPAAERIFGCQAGDHVGRPVWRLYDPSRMEEVLKTRKQSSVLIHLGKEGRVVRETLAFDAKNDLVIALLSDVTEETRQREEMAQLKETSLERAQEVIEKQMRVAQEIAGLLGETTAETKAILTQLMQLFRGSKGQI